MVDPVSKDDIIAQASVCEPHVAEVVDDMAFDDKGVFNSELLLFIAVADLLEVDRIVESGRARGYSTRILAEYFQDTDIDIVSIEKLQGTKDDEIAREYLSGYGHLELRYGDTRDLVSEVLTQSTCILIDGPKGDDALTLALDLLKRDKPEVVFVHDLHRNTLHRDLSELLFTYTFYSDDRDYVRQFKHLDEPCWEYLEDDQWGPYLRKGEEVDSYASTFGVFFNNDDPINTRQAANYRQYLEWKEAPPDTTSFIGQKLRQMGQEGGPVTAPIANALFAVGRKFTG